MLRVLPIVEDPDLSGSAARALAQHLPPWGVVHMCVVHICLFMWVWWTSSVASALTFCWIYWSASVLGCVNKLIAGARLHKCELDVPLVQ